MAALVIASDGSAAALKSETVTLTASGPVPREVTIRATDSVIFANEDSVAHTVVFAHPSCSFSVLPGQRGAYACKPWLVGSYAFTVDGTFPGKLHVVGQLRLISLTARTHAVRPGGQLTLHGRLTHADLGGPCSGGPHDYVWVLARHDHSEPFKRIRKPVAVARNIQRAGPHGCAYPWHLKVRPHERMTYIAQAKGLGRIWRPAKSRTFDVLIRR
jgi:hypothetical protein